VAEEFEQKISKPKIEIENINFEKATLLIADDVKYNREYIKGILRDTQIEILEAENGEIALKLAKEHTLDLIITDIKMPVMDGIELLGKLRENEKLQHIPVIASTAAVMKAEQEHIKNTGFNGFVVKPFEINDLYVELIKFLKHKTVNESMDSNQVKQNDIVKLSDTEKAELMDKLKGDLHKIWEGFGEQQPMEEVEAFANSLLELTQKYAHPLIIAYANNLNEAVAGFDIYSLLKYLKQYPQLIENITNN
jgi:CheY-like chemotaxis protein